MTTPSAADEGAPESASGIIFGMRVTYDPEADAAYIYLTDEQLMPGRDSVPVDPPEGMHAFVVLDWKDKQDRGLGGLGCVGVASPRPARNRRPSRRELAGQRQERKSLHVGVAAVVCVRGPRIRPVWTCCTLPRYGRNSDDAARGVISHCGRSCGYRLG